MLKAYDWPGNIRELENVIERAVVVAEGSTITMQDLPPEMLSAIHDDAAANGSSDTTGTAYPCHRLSMGFTQSGNIADAGSANGSCVPWPPPMATRPKLHGPRPCPKHARQPTEETWP